MRLPSHRVGQPFVRWCSQKKKPHASVANIDINPGKHSNRSWDKKMRPVRKLTGRITSQTAEGKTDNSQLGLRKTSFNPRLAPGKTLSVSNSTRESLSWYSFNPRPSGWRLLIRKSRESVQDWFFGILQPPPAAWEAPHQITDAITEY